MDGIGMRLVQGRYRDETRSGIGTRLDGIGMRLEARQGRYTLLFSSASLGHQDSRRVSRGDPSC